MMKKTVIFLAFILATALSHAQYIIIRKPVLDSAGKDLYVILRPEITVNEGVITCVNHFYFRYDWSRELNVGTDIQINDHYYRLPYYPTVYAMDFNSRLSIVQQGLRGLKNDLLYLNPSWKRRDIYISLKHN